MYQVKKAQNIPISLHEAWDFFSNPDNLEKITPSNLNFKIQAKSGVEKMYPGMIISYRISPLLKMSINWVTEITHIKEKKYFIDNQVKGPYKIWHHEHRFKEITNGIEMRDILFYEIPFGILGRFFHKIMVKKRIEEIFDYREKKIKELFGSL